MSRRKVSILVFISTLGVCLLLFLWVYFINIGKITFQGADDYRIELMNYKTLTCSTDPCSFSLEPGIFDAVLSKYGYYPINKKIDVVRRKSMEYDIKFRIIPYINEITSDVFEYPLTNTGSVPEEIKKYSVIFGNPQNGYIYFDENEQRIKHWKQDIIRTITKFISNQNNYKLQPDAIFHNLVIWNAEGAYVINITTGEKTKIAENEVQSIKWSDNGKYLALEIKEEGEKNFSLYSLAGANTETIDISMTDFTAFTWLNNQEFIYSNINGFFVYNIKTKEKKVLMQGEEIRAEEIILSENKKSVYFKSEGNYYELIFEGE